MVLKEGWALIRGLFTWNQCFQRDESCQKRFPWTNKGVDLARHLVIGLVLQAGDAEKLVLGTDNMLKMCTQKSGDELTAVSLYRTG